jgi:hypothetical protein
MEKSRIPETKKGTAALIQLIQTKAAAEMRGHGKLYADSANCFNMTAFAEEIGRQMNIAIESDLEDFMCYQLSEWFHGSAFRLRFNE